MSACHRSTGSSLVTMVERRRSRSWGISIRSAAPERTEAPVPRMRRSTRPSPRNRRDGGRRPSPARKSANSRRAQRPSATSGAHKGPTASAGGAFGLLAVSAWARCPMVSSAAPWNCGLPRRIWSTPLFHNEDLLDVLRLHSEGAAELPEGTASTAMWRIVMLQWIAAFKRRSTVSCWPRSRASLRCAGRCSGRLAGSHISSGGGERPIPLRCPAIVPCRSHSQRRDAGRLAGDAADRFGSSSISRLVKTLGLTGRPLLPAARRRSSNKRSCFLPARASFRPIASFSLLSSH